jgi:4-carboxymuconolactone decarboxylase
MKKKQDDRIKRGEALLKRMGRLENLQRRRSAYPELYELSAGHLFGEIWTRPHLSLRDRQLITLATNIALDRPHGNHYHYRSAKHIGISKKQIVELIIQVAAYAGWPVVGHAIAQYTQVLEEDAAAEKKLKSEKKSKVAKKKRQATA